MIKNYMRRISPTKCPKSLILVKSVQIDIENEERVNCVYELAGRQITIAKENDEFFLIKDSEGGLYLMGELEFFSKYMEIKGE